MTPAEPANTVTVSAVAVDYGTTYGTVRALWHPGLCVPGGTSLAVMGPSGCGKSTLLGLLAALATPTEGSVQVGAAVLSEMAAGERARFRRENLGMVYQGANLMPHLTVEENVGLSLAIAKRREPRNIAGADGPRHLLERVGLGDLSLRFPDQLSGGQRQRVAVVRAIVHNPAVILADEPTGALDEGNAHAVAELLFDVHRASGATLILVTHDPAIAAYADRTEFLASPGPGPEHEGSR